MEVLAHWPSMFMLVKFGCFIVVTSAFRHVIVSKAAGFSPDPSPGYGSGRKRPLTSTSRPMISTSGNLSSRANDLNEVGSLQSLIEVQRQQVSKPVLNIQNRSWVRGKTHANGVTSFTSMRYATANRWQAPALYTLQSLGGNHTTPYPADGIDHYMGDAYAVRPGSHKPQNCYQKLPHSALERFTFGLVGEVGAEDCFFLDVYTPSSLPIDPDTLLPVMFFIHGGAFLLGDKWQQGLYDARNLAKDQDVVVVNINYRLGPFGWLAHPAQPDASRNLGLKDQRMAMYWTFQHIQFFEGKNTGMTIFGESAGAMSVCAHLASRESHTFFDHAIMESGNCDSEFVYQQPSKAIEHGQRYINRCLAKNTGKWLKHQCVQSSERGAETLAALKPMLEAADAEDQVYAWLQYEAADEPDLAWQYNCARLALTNPDDLWINGLALEKPVETNMNFSAAHAITKWLSNPGEALRDTLKWGRPFETFLAGRMSPNFPWSPVMAPEFRPVNTFDDAGDYLLRQKYGAGRDLTNSNKTGKTVIVGFNKDEGSIFAPVVGAWMGGIGDINKLTLQSLKRALEYFFCGELFPNVLLATKFYHDGERDGQGNVRKLGDSENIMCERNIDTLMTAYQISWIPSDDGNENRRNALEAVIRDYIFACSAKKTAVAATNAGFEVYVYRFMHNVNSGRLLRSLGTFHMAELPFIFNGNSKVVESVMPIKSNEPNSRLSQWFQETWTNLAKGIPLQHPHHPHDESWVPMNYRQFSMDIAAPDRPAKVLSLEEFKEEHKCDLFSQMNQPLDGARSGSKSGPMFADLD